MEGLRGCNTTCGNVSVPYPFGFGPSHCYWPGLDLTCDTSHGGAPRLLLGDGSLRVTDISLRNETVRVMRAGSIINASGAITPSSWNVPFGHGFTEYGYRLSYRNELVVAGCNVAATLLANIGEDTPRFVGGCAAFCTIRHVADGLDVPVGRGIDETSTANVSMRPCADNSGCCRAPVTTTSTPERVMVKWLNSGNHTVDQKAEALNVFVAEEGWIDDYRMVGSYGAEEAPIVLGWSVTRGLPPGHNKCDDDVRRLLCRSENSSCFGTDNLPGVTCQCDNGYDGNPYLPGGCKDDVLPPDKIGLHNCNTTCGDVRVPYPFGTSPGCYWPGFNLTCKARGHDLPRLFLDKDGTLEVVDISLSDSTVRVIHHTRTFNNEIIGTFTPWNDNNGVYSDLPSIVEPYMLSTRNEMILSGCDLRATLCQCRRGTHGNPYEPNGCVNSHTGLIIGLSVASGPGLLLLVLTIILLLKQKINQHRVNALKQKYFKQNRGQLLQQLISQKADIAERMIIPMDELAKATNNFDKARELGGGGHGTVYKGILSDLHVVAIKKSKITVQKEIDEFINEVAILSQVNHKNVVKLFGCCLETEVPLLVYEFISNGTLYHHLHVEGPISLSWANRLRIASEIASSLSYLHSSVSNPIIHRDIKSGNILLDDTLTAKVSDFGASRYIPINQTGLTTRIQGTRGYMDPMCLYTGRLTKKSDVYSFGVVLIELLTRKKPFSYLSTEGDGLAAHFVDLHTKGNIIQILDPQVIEEAGKEVQEVATLAMSCVNLRDEERPTMRQVDHTFEGLQDSNNKNKYGIATADFPNTERQIYEESSRRYSMEQEMLFSSSYPR
ncbi:hypothetical protein HU200_029223 [Digitaria exilis]|uniref:Protein kinase domain-containing protein n=1 Tax=Digitaria exilis TaxID=1010633 RepID=A0A835ERT5_9POAL|nr:hypothetical protein HU200_029223 [Digitaria exilis]